VSEPAFKTCGSCWQSWATWESFVHDPGVRLLGLQAVPGLPAANLLVFEHRCGSSVSVLAQKLRHLLSAEDQAAERPLLFGTETCSGHCVIIENLASCDRPCANARDRRLAILIADAKRGIGGAAPTDPTVGSGRGGGA